MRTQFGSHSGWRISSSRLSIVHVSSRSSTIRNVEFERGHELLRTEDVLQIFVPRAVVARVGERGRFRAGLASGVA